MAAKRKQRAKRRNVGEHSEYRRAIAADDAWSKELHRVFGSKASDVRYKKAGEGPPGSQLRRLFEAKIKADDKLQEMFLKSRAKTNPKKRKPAKRKNAKKTYAEYGAAHRAAGRVKSYVILGMALTNVLKAMRVGQTTTIDGIKIRRVTSGDEYEADGVKIFRAGLVGRLLGEKNPRNATAIERAKKRGARERTEAYAAGVAAALRKMGYRVKVERGERR